VLSDQGERITGVIVGPPGLDPVIGTPVGQRSLPPSGGLLNGHPPSGVIVDHHPETGLPDPAEEVEVLQTEEPLGVGQHTGVDH